MNIHPEKSTDTHQLSRLKLLPVIVEAALLCVKRSGVEEQPANVSGLVRIFLNGSIMICYTTPSVGIPASPGNFGIDIWFKDKKTFSAWWNSHLLRDYDLISLKRGPWLPALLAMAAKLE